MLCVMAKSWFAFFSWPSCSTSCFTAKICFPLFLWPSCATILQDSLTCLCVQRDLLEHSALGRVAGITLQLLAALLDIANPELPVRCFGLQLGVRVHRVLSYG